jgi:glutamate N-acetyltransferase / amino-acid N-acetyltransferase
MIPKGFRFAGVRCGLKNRKNDIGLILCEAPVQAAGVFTTNQFRASCVDFSRSAVSEGRLQAILVNSGNANCATGTQGERNTTRMAELTNEVFGLHGKVAVSSTGIIGQQLDMVKVEKGIRSAAQHIVADTKPFLEAILTTDLVEKWSAISNSENADLCNPRNSNSYTSGDASVYGCCKGSGMISPNMATMLGFVLTDFDLSDFDLQAILSQACASSFNRLTVDGDTSTNDMVFLLASGASGIRPSLEQAQELISKVCEDLAKQVARDGEGATKLIEVRVTHPTDPESIARTIANSPLVKTAMFGCDPNWGRIVAAAGRAGVPFKIEDVVLNLEIEGESYLLFESGKPTSFDPKKVSNALKADEIVINLHCGDGQTDRIFTCDFGYGYVRINAEYHT